ncbi:flagellar hook-basal body complex subunit FliE [Thermaerobacter marianensis DSM 12885]|uniref:Flagellar hook-basal body complex protein FliE n=1 Tax=Thermaerobacter marianensis (strain ATCC 700841 / DSM 12885 / JCM 10246 / 7p75a) TaxID=644966 RepID=E6SJM7_THEM7|nr:flagellar hook-basal body complex protein FliE [Thermaerobacter marianensis]ADU51090.1 flagellar hook-basal body complex subunit FliE [Thermaerobacter marianensis DSM 12885]
MSPWGAVPTGWTSAGPAGWAGMPGGPGGVGGAAGGTAPGRAPAGSSGGEGPSFLQELARALQQLEGTAGQADAMAQRLLTGDVQDLSQVMVATEKARLAIELAVQLRNKALEAYQEIMRMPV